MMKKATASETEIKKLYDENTFYEYGDNPAYKKFMEISVENLKQGKLPDYRTVFKEKFRRIFLARNWEDFLQRDLKCLTFPRTLAVFGLSSMSVLLASRWTRSFLPLGQHGINRVSQTQFYHLYGPLGVAGVLAMPSIALYLWYQTFCFTAKRFYNHCILGERNWVLESEKQNPGYGEYYFKDSPLSCEESFPDLARGEMAKKQIEFPA